MERESGDPEKIIIFQKIFIINPLNFMVIASISPWLE